MRFNGIAELIRYRYRLRRYYRQTFHSPTGRIVLADLVKTFYGLDDDLYRKDPRAEAFILGQRRVIQRIVRWLNMTMEEIESVAKSKEEHEE